jgi:plasmid stabilization system protein ParE
MVKQIIWTQSAINDLENIYSYIHNSDDAKSRIMLLIVAIEKLEKFPLNVTKYNGIPNNQYYELKHSSYKVLVKPIESKLYIMAIVYGSITA